MNITQWTERVHNRADIVTRLTHLTRATESMDALEVLVKILEDKRLIGSTTQSGYIVGNTPAVCLQETPLEALAAHIRYENESFGQIDKCDVRYSGIGIRFNKVFVYRSGGRPVIYDKTEYLKSILPEEQYWRIVNFDLDNNENCIDWTHEREWRVPNELVFDYDKIELIFPTDEVYRRFVSYCEENNKIHIMKEIHGILILSSIVS
ncbi:MAG: DUF2971 domain-containing protein [Lachnospiraceae bacterium]|nr:DUF2971 domain-containing protein [Lachnospiraceae bacterium]